MKGVWGGGRAPGSKKTVQMLGRGCVKGGRKNNEEEMCTSNTQPRSSTHHQTNKQSEKKAMKNKKEIQKSRTTAVSSNGLANNKDMVQERANEKNTV